MGKEGEIVKKIVNAYEIIPKGYGIAYRKYDMDATVCYPIPFNIFVALFRRIYIWFIHGANLYNDGYDRGYGKGLTEGRKYAFNQFRVQVIKNEIPTIIKNFLEREKNSLENMREGKNIDSWLLDFIKEEQKRLSK